MFILPKHCYWQMATKKVTEVKQFKNAPSSESLLWLNFCSIQIKKKHSKIK